MATEPFEAPESSDTVRCLGVRPTRMIAEGAPSQAWSIFTVFDVMQSAAFQKKLLLRVAEMIEMYGVAGFNEYQDLRAAAGITLTDEWQRVLPALSGSSGGN